MSLFLFLKKAFVTNNNAIIFAVSLTSGFVTFTLSILILMPLKRKQVQLKVTTIGEPNLEAMSESEQKAFYVSMLMRILDKRRQQLEEQSSVNAQKDNAVPEL